MKQLQELGKLAIERGCTISGYVCPACDGGRSRERSLSMWPHQSLPGFAVAKCWRNSCGWGAAIIVFDSIGSAPTLSYLKPAATPIMRALTQDAEAFLLERYLLTSETLSFWKVRQHPDTSSIYIPVYDRMRNLRGYVHRKFGNYSGQKAIGIVTQPAEVWQAWFGHPALTQVVLVEDCLSAMRLWRLGFTAVALLGTSLTPSKLDELRYVTRTKRIIVALDGDATAKAIAWCRHKYANLVPAILWRDIKDSSDSEILAVLGKGNV